MSPKRAGVGGVSGVGLGLRWPFLEEVLETLPSSVDFWEVAPENYMRRGGYYPAMLERLGEHYAFVTHGLTLSLGAEERPRADYLRELRAEVQRLGVPWHSDHICFSTHGPWVLHDLLPLKFSRPNATRVADNTRRAEDALGCPMLVENISWYCHPGRPELSEAEFLTLILEQAECGLLLDVNNVYVNSQNHGFDPKAFLLDLPLDRVREIHVAGHTEDAEGLLIDTHGAPLIDPVYDLLAFALARTGRVPVLLERDNAIPALGDLLGEVQELKRVYETATANWPAGAP